MDCTPEYTFAPVSLNPSNLEGLHQETCFSSQESGYSSTIETKTNTNTSLAQFSFKRKDTQTENKHYRYVHIIYL